MKHRAPIFFITAFVAISVFVGRAEGTTGEMSHVETGQSHLDSLQYYKNIEVGEHRIPLLVEELLDGDCRILEEKSLKNLLSYQLDERDQEKGTSKEGSTDFWRMIYEMNRSFFIESSRKHQRFRMELFVEASGCEENLAALARLCADFYAEQKQRVTSGELDEDDLGKCFTAKYLGKDEPALCHFIWTYPTTAPRIIDAFTSSKKGWKKECLNVWKFLLGQKDLHGTSPILLAYDFRRNVCGEGLWMVDIFSVLTRSLSANEWSVSPVEANEYGEETYLAHAVKKQNYNLLQALLDSGFDPNVQIEGNGLANKETVLHRAIWMRWEEGARLLVDRGAKNLPKADGTTPYELLDYCMSNEPGRWKKWRRSSNEYPWWCIKEHLK